MILHFNAIQYDYLGKMLFLTKNLQRVVPKKNLKNDSVVVKNITFSYCLI